MNWKKWVEWIDASSSQQKWLLTAVFLGLILYFSLSGFILPKIKSCLVRSRDCIELEKKRQVTPETIDQLKSLGDQLTSLNLERNRFAQKILSGEGQVSFYHDLVQAAQQVHLSLQTLTKKTPGPQETTAAPEGLAKASLELVAEGNYETLTSFLQNLEQHKKPLTIENLTLAPSETTGRLTLRAVVSTYGL